MRSVLKNKKGAAAIEYGLIVALIAVAIIPALNALGDGDGDRTGDGITDVFRCARNALQDVRIAQRKGAACDRVGALD